MKAKKLPLGLRILFGFLSLILCVALFATTLAAIILADVRVMTSEENMKTIISYVMFGTPIQKNSPIALQAAGAVKLDEANVGMAGGQQMVIDMLYEMLSDQFGEEVPFTQDEVQDLLDQSTIPDFLSEKMAGVMSDIYTGDLTTTITGEEVVQLLEENKELIEDTIGVELSEEYKNAIKEKVDEMDIATKVQDIVLGRNPLNPDSPEGEGGNGVMGGNAVDKFPNGVLNGLISGAVTFQDVIDGGISVILMLMRELTSLEMLLIVLAACLVLIALLFVVNLKQLRVAFRCVGGTLMLAGAPFAASAILAFAVPSLFEGALAIVYLVATLTAGVSIGVFGGGFVLSIVGIVMTAVYKKNLKTPVAVAVEAPVEAVPVMPVLTYAPVAAPAPVAAAVPEQPEETVAEPVTAEEPVVEAAPVVEDMPVMEEIEPVELPVSEDETEEAAEEVPTEEPVKEEVPEQV